MALADRVRRYVPMRRCDSATAAILGDTLPRATARTEVVATSQRRSVAGTPVLEAGAPAAVLLRGTCWGEVWLIADDDVLDDHPDIATAGLPVVRFAELPHLERLDAAARRALGLVKRSFPTARVLQ